MFPINGNSNNTIILISILWKQFQGRPWNALGVQGPKPEIETVKKYTDICDVLGVDRATFDAVIADKTNYYYSYPIRKRNGTKRYIDAPVGILKEWQETLIKRVLYRFGAHPIAYGFAKNRNPILAAEVHVGQKILVAMDIKNFFNSITKESLINLFTYLDKAKPIWSSGSIPNTQDIVEVLTYRDIVPQGAPSSPALSNLYMLRADKLLHRIAATNNYKLSRYADDIVFSGDDSDMPGKTIPQTKRILKQYGLRLNPDKVHINRSNKRMRVVGIVVNEKTNIPRETWRNFRARLHNLKVGCTPIDEKTAQQLRGKIEWYKSVNPTRGQQFLAEYGQLNFLSTSHISTAIRI